MVNIYGILSISSTTGWTTVLRGVEPPPSLLLLLGVSYPDLFDKTN
jgi:hypothetical protein